MRRFGRTAALVAAGTMAAGVAMATPASALPSDVAAAMIDCEAQYICLWSGESYQGDLWRYWSPGGSYQDLPIWLKDHVGSFIASGSGAFINYAGATKECRTVTPGDFNVIYDRGFGGRMDAVGANC